MVQVPCPWNSPSLNSPTYLLPLALVMVPCPHVAKKHGNRQADGGGKAFHSEQSASILLNLEFCHEWSCALWSIRAAMQSVHSPHKRTAD